MRDLVPPHPGAPPLVNEGLGVAARALRGTEHLLDSEVVLELELIGELLLELLGIASEEGGRRYDSSVRTLGMNNSC